MDDGVKHRLSNVIAWAGFAAAMVKLLYAVLWGVFVLQPYKAEQASISADRLVADEAIKSLESNPYILMLCQLNIPLFYDFRNYAGSYCFTTLSNGKL